MRLLILALLVPSVASAQLECPGCVIGIFDDPGLSRNFGVWDITAVPLKTVWVGIIYDPTSHIDGLTSIELSVDGVGAFCQEAPCFSFEGLVEPTVTIGPTIAAPDDTANGQGGMNMAWNQCLRADRALVRLDLSSVETLANDLVLRVTQKFPQSSPEFRTPGLPAANWFSRRSRSPGDATSSTRRRHPGRRWATAC
jgi:hypothetical protein